MARRLGHVAEVIRGRDDADAEVVHPETVHEHARGERIGAAGDRQGEFAATAAFVERQAVRAGEDLEELAGGDGTALVAVAADVHVAVARLLGVGDHHRGAGASGVGDVERVDLAEVEMLRGLVVIDEGGADRDLPGFAEITALGQALEERDGGDVFDVGQGPGEGGELGDRGVVFVALAARLAAQLDMGGDLVAVLLEHRLVSQGHLVEGLRLEAAKAFGDERVDRILLVREGGLEDGRGLRREVLRGDLLQADERSGDRMFRASHDAGEGGAEFAAFAEVVLLEDVETSRATETADHRGERARGELPMERGLHAGKMAVVAPGGLVDELGELLLIIRPVGVARGVLADEERVADDGVLLRLDDRGEDAVQRVVVGGRDRVELMVVATGAGDGQAQETLRGGVDALVDGVIVVLEALADGDETERGEARVVLREVGEAVGGELLDDELVVRLVGIESIDDVIAVGPGGLEGLDGAVALQSLRVGVTGGVEPVAAPAFAVVRRGEQAVHGAFDDAGDGAGRLTLARGHGIHGEGGVIVAGEGVDLDARGRQADQVIRKAAEERFAVGGGAGAETLLVELGQDEGVDLVREPGGIADLGRHGDLADRLERPVSARLGGKSGELLAAGAGGGRRAHLHPLFQGGDLRRGKLGARLARRHGNIGVSLMDGDKQEGLLQVARHDGRTEVAAREHAGAGIHDEAALGDTLLLGVTLIATLGEDRADVLLEELQAGRIHLRLGGGVGGDEYGGERREGEQTEGSEQRVHGGEAGGGNS